MQITFNNESESENTSRDRLGESARRRNYANINAACVDLPARDSHLSIAGAHIRIYIYLSPINQVNTGQLGVRVAAAGNNRVCCAKTAPLAIQSQNHLHKTPSACSMLMYATGRTDGRTHQQLQTKSFNLHPKARQAIWKAEKIYYTVCFEEKYRNILF